MDVWILSRVIFLNLISKMAERARIWQLIGNECSQIDLDWMDELLFFAYSSAVLLLVCARAVRVRIWLDMLSMNYDKNCVVSLCELSFCTKSGGFPYCENGVLLLMIKCSED